MSFRNFYLLNEMIVSGSLTDFSHLLAYGKWIYLFEETNNNEETRQKILTDLKLNPEIFSNIKDIQDFLAEIVDRVSDVVVGTIRNKKLTVFNAGIKVDPKSSTLIKKIVQTLKLKSVDYWEDVESTETTVPKKKILGNIPDIVYHGTSSIYLLSILRKGLVAGEAESNYAKQGIIHPELIFFASRIGEAVHHAETTFRQKGGIPVILELKIPDKDQIIADYDIEKMTQNNQYYKNIDSPSRLKYSQSYQQNPDKLSKHFGIYGYKKRIPASFIHSVWLGSPEPESGFYELVDFKKFKPQRVLKMLEQGMIY